jgi:hypothetical protein
MAVEKPNVFQKIWYAFGGKLPMRYREWVLDDSTRAGWLRRFTGRTMLQVLPLTLVVALALVLGLGSPVGLAIACGGLGFIVGVYFSLSYAVESTENRITKYGYKHGAASDIRKEKNAARDEERQNRYNASWRTDDQA